MSRRSLGPRFSLVRPQSQRRSGAPFFRRPPGVAPPPPVAPGLGTGVLYRGRPARKYRRPCRLASATPTVPFLRPRPGPVAQSPRAGHPLRSQFWRPCSHPLFEESSSPPSHLPNSRHQHQRIWLHPCHWRTQQRGLASLTTIAKRHSVTLDLSTKGKSSRLRQPISTQRSINQDRHIYPSGGRAQGGNLRLGILRGTRYVKHPNRPSSD